MDVVTGGGSNTSAPRLSTSSRRRSVGDIKQQTAIDGDNESTSSTESSSKATNPELWLTDEIEAVGELKRGAIAARFPEEFSVDSDFLNGASNVWLPARLHPEIAPGEFQDWLKKHGSQLSKIEDSVHRRKSILSYSYKTGDDPVVAEPHRFGDMAAVRRRNTTGLVRRKSFVERADEEATDDAPFLVQTTQRSSLKRSKLANKRRDSTASTSADGRGERRRRGYNHDASVPSVSSPLAPPVGDDNEETDTDSAVQYHQPQSAPKNSHHHHQSRPSGTQPQSAAMSHSSGALPASAMPQQPSASEKRMSTAEILKQVTAAVDDFGFDEFELGDLPTYEANAAAGSRNGKKLKRPGQPPAVAAAAGLKAPTAPLPRMPPQPQPSAGELEPVTDRKSVAHKKSGGSWWQWGREDAQAAAAESDRDRRSSPSPPTSGQQQQQQPIAMVKPKSATESHSNATSPPVPVHLPHAQTAPLISQGAGNEPPSASVKGKLPSPIAFLRFNRKSKKDRRSEEQPAANPTPPLPVPQPSAPPLTVQRHDDTVSDASSDTDASSANGANSARPKQAASQHSHIPSIITPVRPPPTTRLGVGNTRLPIHIERAIYRLASIKLANPRRPLLQQVLLSNMMFWYLELINPRSQQAQQAAAAAGGSQDYHNQSSSSPKSPAKQPAAGQSPRSGSPHQPQPQQQKQPSATGDKGGSSERRGKRGAGPVPGKPHDPAAGNRRRSGGSGSERVVMRSPQYERQQQQIYSNGQSPRQSSGPQSAGPHSDEDDDVPLALYRGERNPMSIG
ncbi:hypothetical protein GGI13_000430 [Coemansia sp. RSA 455]|nr:hypothetical protein GGI14_000656 [Coemansia sp. S680]KAJ2052423.1 hypothetical protein H4S04_001339 [Coemansia sp. S16]KAJ2258805.1 hypothetical protein GGI13_000430 [Coemansia sp. RSA 455]